MSKNQLSRFKNQDFNFDWWLAARTVVDSDSISLGETHITNATDPILTNQSSIVAESLGLINIGKSA